MTESNKWLPPSSPALSWSNNMGRHIALKQSDLDALLEWLGPCREQAGEKYEAIRNTLTRYFEGRRCVPADEHVDETIDRVARRVAAGERIRASDPRRYFYGVAKNILLELRKPPALPQLQQGCEVSAIDELASSPRLSCLRCCLTSLEPGEQELLEAYYLDARAELAARQDITPNALRIRVFKTKQKLRGCIARCLRGQHR
jgi:DNA-directed RNA polymerase specialized sigma24 family protein